MTVDEIPTQIAETATPRPPAAIPLEDTKPLPTIQRARHEALRLAIAHHRATEDEFDDVDVLTTAHRFNDFIRNGTVPPRTGKD